jgi:Rrf2 family protein
LLTTKAKYGLKALTRLARRYRDEQLVSIAEIAETEHIPLKFLEAILVELKRHGLLQSRRGPAGGYRLAVAPSEITVAQVVRILNGPLALTTCTSVNRYARCEECHDEATCVVRGVMREARDAIAAVLEHQTLEDLVHWTATEEDTKSAPMYYI